METKKITPSQIALILGIALLAAITTAYSTSQGQQRLIDESASPEPAVSY